MDIVKAQSLKRFDIEVETMQGTEHLSCFVYTRSKKDQPGKIGHAVKGMAAVRNGVLVR